MSHPNQLKDPKGCPICERFSLDSIAISGTGKDCPWNEPAALARQPAFACIPLVLACRTPNDNGQHISLFGYPNLSPL